jgi:2,4-dienoyl-CoA reductase-like NADH-dependent reductase (Old Yellow Enzyme family)
MTARDDRHLTLYTPPTLTWDPAELPAVPRRAGAAGGAAELSTPLALPCGAVLPNRLVKAAMTEGLADPEGRATEEHMRLYERWARGGTGMLLTGNIQIDLRSLERPGNIRIEGPQNAEQLARLRALAYAGRLGGGHIWAQLSHAGRQAVASCCPAPVAPSAVPLVGSAYGYQPPPRALSEDEIVEIIARFGAAAAICREAGFTGVQIHGAHGYLVNQFLSPATNLRTDAWGGPLEHRARFLLEVVRTVRAAVGPDFPVGLKLNSADFQSGGFTHAESMAVIEMLNHEALDLLELTGGTYEQLSMLGARAEAGAEARPVRASTVAREAYFAVYAAAARRVARMPMMSTGGFRRRASMIGALNDGTCDLIGLGRPLVTDPDVSAKLLAGAVEEVDRYEDVWQLAPGATAGLSGRDLEHARALGLEALFYDALFDMADGREPCLTRPLDVAQDEVTARDDAVARGIVELYGLARAA